MPTKRSTVAKSDGPVTPNSSQKIATIGWRERSGDRYHVRLAAATIGMPMSEFMRRAVLAEVSRVLGREAAV